MAGYRDELERLNFSAEEKEALTCRLLERRSGQEEKRPRFPYRGLVAIVAAASLLTGAVGAVSLAGVSPAFRELFGITSEEQAKNLGIVQMNQVFEDKNGSGATVTVKEMCIRDSFGIISHRSPFCKVFFIPAQKRARIAPGPVSYTHLSGASASGI